MRKHIDPSEIIPCGVPSNKKFKDRTGLSIGALQTVQLFRHVNGGYFWLCQCVCGKNMMIRSNAWKNTKSCGCQNPKGTTHGMAYTSIYRVWKSMISRCFNRNNRNWHNYGGRGIMVCDRWTDFTLFFEDMGHNPPGLSLDRIDNNGSYCKENCRWASPREQGQNRRMSVLITFQGRTLCVSEWARRVGLKMDTVWKRIYRCGWSVEKSLTVPVQVPPSMR